MSESWKTMAPGQKFVASYSGGKDSTLALYHALKMGQAAGLIAMLEEHGQRSRSHAMPLEIIHAQAQALGLPILLASASWQSYEAEFLKMLSEARQLGAEVLVNGDLDMPEHGCWHEKVAAQAGLQLCMPLWQRPHLEVIQEFIQLGFQTMLVTVNLKLGMTAADLGRIMTLDYVDELLRRGIDPCGEGGEFHTTVLDGPLFKKPISVRQGEILYHGDYAFLALELEHH